MTNKYLETILKNNNSFIKEVENAILKEIPFCSDYIELEKRLNENTDLVFLFDANSSNKLHVCCNEIDYVEFFDSPSLAYYNNISYSVDFKNQNLRLSSIFFTCGENKITISPLSTKLSRTFTDEEYQGAFCNSIDWLSAGFVHLAPYPAFTSAIEIEADDKTSKEALDFYTTMKNISVDHPVEIYEYLFDNKKIDTETQEVIQLTSDTLIDFNDSNFDKFKFNINEIDLEYREEKKLKVTNKKSMINK